MSKVRHALAADIPQLMLTLTSAFFEDPLTSWMYPDVDSRGECLAVWNRFVLEMSLTRGHCYTTAGNGATALWSPPDVTLYDDYYAPKLLEVLRELLGERVGEVLPALARAMAQHGEPEPHFYLFILGTHAQKQGRGLGAEVIAPILEICDREGLPAKLESSNPANIPFYQRHGFEVTEQIEIAEGGPIISPMRRAPR